MVCGCVYIYIYIHIYLYTIYVIWIGTSHTFFTQWGWEGATYVWYGFPIFFYQKDNEKFTDFSILYFLYLIAKIQVVTVLKIGKVSLP